jgi:hypothetical protein
MHVLPAMPDWQRNIRIDHIYTQTLLTFCSVVGVRPLGRVLAERKSTLFCSVAQLAPCENAHKTDARVVSKTATPGFDGIQAELHYTTSHIHSDTTRMELHNGDRIAVIAQQRSVIGERVIFHPLVMGSPWLVADNEVLPGAMWHSFDFFEQYVEDIDEFSKVRDIPAPSSFEVMGHISERAFKQCLTEILADSSKKDWGGEVSDHFSAHVHLGGKRTTAAFLLKGPARFPSMTLTHLGKNNDQIVRLSKEPAQLLVVQHCHDIDSAVRATLRAFAVQPGQ